MIRGGRRSRRPHRRAVCGQRRGERADRTNLIRSPAAPIHLGAVINVPRPLRAAAQKSACRTLAGQPPNPELQIDGCAFAPRCANATPRCRLERPLLHDVGAAAQFACHHPLPA